MFVTRNIVRTHDTDLAGILYFPRIYRFANDAIEDFMASEGHNFDQVFRLGKSIFVIVHSEADYYAPLRVGDKLIVQIATESIGNTSFTLIYEIFKEDHTHVGTVKTVHVSMDRKSHTKIPVPPEMRKALEQHLVTDKPSEK